MLQVRIRMITVYILLVADPMIYSTESQHVLIYSDKAHALSAIYHCNPQTKYQIKVY